MAEEDSRGFRIASAYVAVGLDQTGLDAGISDVESKLNGIRDRAIGIGLDPAAVDAAIRENQARLDSLRGGSAGVGVSQAELDQAIAEIKAKLAALGADHVKIRIGADRRRPGDGGADQPGRGHAGSRAELGCAGRGDLRPRCR